MTVTGAGWSPAPGAEGPGFTRVGAPKAHPDVRIANMSLLLRRLRAAPSLSRADLVRATGLSKATVSTLVAELVTRGLVAEQAPGAQGAVGRPGTALRLAAQAAAGVGVEIGPASLSVTVLDLGGAVLRRRTVTRSDTVGSEPGPVLEQVGRVLAEELGRQRECGAAVPRVVLAQPGVLDYARGRVLTSTPLGWHEVPVVERVAAALERHLPEGTAMPRLVVENDARLAALAVYGAYAEQGVRDLLYLSGGRGIGAGVIADGRLLRGWQGLTGEVGHMPLADDDRRCRCGRRGCWETAVGLDAVTAALPPDDPARDADRPVDERLNLLRRHLASCNEGPGGGGNGGNGAPRGGEPAGERAGEPGAAAAGTADAPGTGLAEHLVRVRRDLERGLAVLVEVLGPQVVVLSGWPAACAEQVVGPLTRFLDARRVDGRARTRIEVSPLGQWAASHGGAVVSLEAVLDDPTLLPL